MGTQRELHDFLRTNKDAWPLAAKGTEDYLLARLGMLHGMWSSFEMATQAVEKLLKAYLLMASADLTRSLSAMRNAVKLESKRLGRKGQREHDVAACLTLAVRAGLPTSPGMQERIHRINEYYAQRYPVDGPSSLGTNELHDVDHAVFGIWDAFEALHPDYYFVGGLVTEFYGLLLHEHHGRRSPLSRIAILADRNGAFDERRAKLERGIRDRLGQWYPPPRVTAA